MVHGHALHCDATHPWMLAGWSDGRAQVKTGVGIGGTWMLARPPTLRQFCGKFVRPI